MLILPKQSRVVTMNKYTVTGNPVSQKFNPPTIPTYFSALKPAICVVRVHSDQKIDFWFPVLVATVQYHCGRFGRSSRQINSQAVDGSVMSKLLHAKPKHNKAIPPTNVRKNLWSTLMNTQPGPKNIKHCWKLIIPQPHLMFTPDGQANVC